MDELTGHESNSNFRRPKLSQGLQFDASFVNLNQSSYDASVIDSNENTNMEREI